MRELRISDAIIRPELGVVLVDGKEQALKPKAMEVLELLATSPGELISKRDLVDTVWGAAVVTDEVLTQAIYEIRQALKGSAAGGLIRTVPRRGYMLETPVQIQGNEDKKPTRVWGLALATLIVVITVIAWFSRPDGSGTSAQPAETNAATGVARQLETSVDKRSLAILPFENRSKLVDDEFFVVGIHDDLLTSIAKIGSLKVISRTSVMDYKNTTKKIPLIAKELGVANILEGSVQRSGNQVRINVQLIDAASDEHLWAEIFDRELTAENLFSIQSEISRNIAEALHAVLTVDEKNRINTIPTSNLQAYESYLRGRQLMVSRNSTQLEQAINAFTEAVEQDAQFALAWVHLADATDLLAGYGTLARSAAIPVMEDAVERALAINPQLGEAYASQANIFEHYQRYDDAEASYRLAIELSPNYATAYQWLSDLVFRRSRLRTTESLLLAKKAYELDPGSLIIGFNLATRYRNQGLYSIAEHQLNKLIEMEPRFAKAYSGLGRIYALDLGRYDKSLMAMLRASALDPDNPNILMNLVEVNQQIGDVDAIKDIRKRVVQLTGEDFWLASFVDVWIDITENHLPDAQATLTEILPQTGSNTFVKESAGLFELIVGSAAHSRELFLMADSAWQTPDQWQHLIQKDPRRACIFSWILINTGDIESGNDLLQQTTALLDESLPMAIEHSDAWSPEICYLTSGDVEKALDSIETQLEHGHLYWRDFYYRMPMYDLIRNEPRFLTAIEERDRLIAIQREAVTQMVVVQSPQ